MMKWMMMAALVAANLVGAARTLTARVALSLALILGIAPLAQAQPQIVRQPIDTYVDVGKTASLNFGFHSTTPYTNQWFFNGVALPDATNTVLTFANAQPFLNGDYFVVLGNDSGSVTSQVARLKVFVHAPHSIANLQMRPDGSAALGLAGETTSAFARYYDLYPLETSSNLVNWAPLVTLQRTNAALDTLLFLDTNAPGVGQRFYRTPTNQLATPDPQPTGPYAVGTFSMVMIDPSRTNAIGKTNYQFMATFWYPAVAQAGVLPAKYVEPQVASSQFTSLGGKNYYSQVVAFFSHSLSNAPLASSPTKCPVLLYSPGYTNHRRCATDQEEELASWGYIVVGLDGIDCYASVFPDGRIAYGQWVAQTAAQWKVAADGRMRDMQFVMDELGRLNASDPRLSGRLDLDHIGAFGWSVGGATVAQLCLYEPRCKAGVSLDGDILDPNLLTQPLKAPYLHLRASNALDPDPGPYYPDGSPDPRFLMYNAQVADAYWLKLGSSVHGTFGDQNLIADSTSLATVYGVPLSGQFLPPARASQIIRAHLLSFFSKFLKGEDDHLLDGPSPAYPEIVQFLSTSNQPSGPRYPRSGLLEGGDGYLYGTTAYGGANGCGTVFRVATNGVWTTLVSFNGTNGSHPTAALIRSSDGNFYGTTAFGGGDGNNGTVFQMTPAGALTMVVSPGGTNGSHPFAALMQGNDGSLYGTTISGGAYGLGTVFKMTPAGVLATLVSFKDPHGMSPYGALVAGSDGNLYGTTSAGVTTTMGGDVFAITPDGVLTNLAGFNGGNGWFPCTSVVQGLDGNLYGTTTYGGNTSLNAGYGLGTVFRVTPPHTLTALVTFNGANGSHCASGLLQGSDGNFYGMTAGGGPGGGGMVFKMTPAGALTTLVAFNNANGACPLGSLMQASDGSFYGTTQYGGPGGAGTVFQMTPAGVLKTLVAFGGQAHSP